MATRVAEERGAILGDEVGYLIRFDDCFHPDATRIKVRLYISISFLNKENDIYSRPKQTGLTQIRPVEQFEQGSTLFVIPSLHLTL